MDEENKGRFERWHDKNYKKLLLIPIILLILSFMYLAIFSSNNDGLFRKDISLTGGTTVTIEGVNLSKAELQEALSSRLEDVNIREISDIITNKRTAVIVETRSDSDAARKAIEDVVGFTLTESNSSFEFTGAALSQSFFKQLIIAIILAFVFMAFVVFLIFRALVPSGAVIISAFADIIMTLTLFNILGLKLSSAGIVAFLMLIGYSVDTDILLTNRVLKRSEGTVNDRLFKSFKTGITMTLTSIIAFGIALFIVSSFSVVLTQIFTILLIGLGFDLINTWITNVSLIKWYAKRKNKV